MDADHLIEYRLGDSVPLPASVACLDYIVAKPGGNLVAYRLDGEASLQAGKFACMVKSGRVDARKTSGGMFT